MNNLQKNRLIYISIIAIGLAIATGLILYALKQNINVFLSPSEITALHLKPNYQIRLGGLVKKNSIQRQANGLEVTFIVTDYKKEITVHYLGVLPDLFSEGKGVIAEGILQSPSYFAAKSILAKHDENYLPKKIDPPSREMNHA